MTRGQCIGAFTSHVASNYFRKSEKALLRALSFELPTPGT